MKKGLTWTVGFSENENFSPAKNVPASVPGAVQLDWAKAEGWGEYTYADNYKQYSWMEDVYWTYAAKLDFPPLESGKRLYFVSKGIDYKFKIKLAGKVIFEQEGMFTPVEIDLTGMASSGDELEILVFPAPKREGASADRSQADQCCKPAVSYGWDWHPRLIPLGIWDETYLEIRNGCHLTSCEVGYTLCDDYKKAQLSLLAELNNPCAGFIVWQFFDKHDNLLFKLENREPKQTTNLCAVLDNPELWWPNGQGEAVLYTSKVELYDDEGNLLDEKLSRIGFRTVKLVMYPDAWWYPGGFPKSRSHPPITMEINGRQIFCKGSNWVNPEIFPGTITRETYEPLVKLAQEGNMNLLRCWGGAIVNKDSFFDLCDAYGILVWQEFPLACNNYEGTPQYLKVLDQESKSIIRRLRSHACLALWCGGNELFNGWSGMTEQSLALRLLDRNCYDLDANTPFIMTSPLSGMAHGHYVFRDSDGWEVFEVMPKAENTAYTEFGCPGPSPVEYLKTFIPQEELYPPRPGTAWESHHAFGAWGEDRWLMPQIIEYYFGQVKSLEELVEYGQILQNEGYKCIFEEARRQKPRCSMALNWCYNEPWPTAANNSIINWPAQPKPSYHAVKASCRPVLASARIPRYSWKEGELFSSELWILNDSPVCVPAGRIEVFLKLGEHEISLLTWDFPALSPNTNLPGPVIRFTLPGVQANKMELKLISATNPGIDSVYVLPYTPKYTKSGHEGTRMLNT